MKKLLFILACSVMMCACDNLTPLQKQVKSLAEHYNSMCPFDVEDIHITRVDAEVDLAMISFQCEVSNQKIDDIRASKKLEAKIEELLIDEFIKENNMLYGTIQEGAWVKFRLCNTETKNVFAININSSTIEKKAKKHEIEPQIRMDVQKSLITLYIELPEEDLSTSGLDYIKSKEFSSEWKFFGDTFRNTWISGLVGPIAEELSEVLPDNIIITFNTNPTDWIVTKIKDLGLSLKIALTNKNGDILNEVLITPDVEIVKYDDLDDYELAIDALSQEIGKALEKMERIFRSESEYISDNTIEQ